MVFFMAKIPRLKKSTRECEVAGFRPTNPVLPCRSRYLGPGHALRFRSV
jgi:hypothetical protein